MKNHNFLNSHFASLPGTEYLCRPRFEVCQAIKFSLDAKRNSCEALYSFILLPVFTLQSTLM